MKPIILSIILSIAFVFIQDTQAQKMVKTESANRGPSRSSLEEMFGKPIDKSEDKSLCFNPETKKPVVCPCASGEYVCFKKDYLFIQVKFNASEYPETAEIFTSSDPGKLNRIATEFIFGEISENTLKKFNEILKRDKRNSLVGCQRIYKYEDDYFALNYIIGAELCTNSVPYNLKITWKK
jgi:hypothetical protein